MSINAKDLIIYEDNDLVVCSKPAGLPVQTRRIGQMDLESLLKNEFAGRDRGKEKFPYLGIIHRLDQPVEGVTLFAKNQNAAARLSAELQKNQMTKEYLAVTEWNVSREKGTLVDWLRKDGRRNMSVVVPDKSPDAKRAELSYELLETKGDLHLLKIQLKTGRHHQIRVQMANAGMPLLGDCKYGISKAAEGQEPRNISNQSPVRSSAQDYTGSVALCAYRLSFCHPKTGKKLSFVHKPTGSAFSIFDI